MAQKNCGTLLPQQISTSQMAYAKTTPLQVALQLGVGLGVAGLFYYSLYKPENNPALVPQAAKDAAKPSGSSDQQLRALEQEAKKTTAQVWGLDASKKPDAAASRTS